ncbi:DnaD domain protein [Priestia megaterium]|uniref:DnaD domain protein n=1 Tax=Priestia megaterium TaxID=1404 RepID=UPI0030C90C2A
MDNKENLVNISDKEKRRTLRILLNQTMVSTPEEKEIIEKAIMLLNDRWGLPLKEKESPTKEALLIKQLKLTTPYELLCEFNGGFEPSSNDVSLVVKIKDKYELEDEVLNVLIYCTMLRNNFKLTKDFVFKLAASLKAQKVGTVEDAMEYAKVKFGKNKSESVEK